MAKIPRMSSLATRVFQALKEKPDSIRGLHERGLAAENLIQRICSRGREAGYIVEDHREQTAPKSRPRQIYRLTPLALDMLEGPDPDGHLSWLSARVPKSPADKPPEGSSGAILKVLFDEAMSVAEAGRRVGVSRAAAFGHIKQARAFMAALPAQLDEIFRVLRPQGVGELKARGFFTDLHGMGALKFTAEGIALSPAGEELAKRIAVSRPTA